MSMVEQVARAIAQSIHGTPNAVGEEERQHARAAIKAMREPSEAMMIASAARPHELMQLYWQRMIDAALEESK